MSHRLASLTLVCLAAGACGKVAFRGTKEASAYKTTLRTIPAIRGPAGSRAVLVAEGFNYPTSVAWDAAGRMYVLESHTVPIPTLEPKIMRIADRADPVKVEVGGPEAPTGKQAVGLVFHDGWLYWSHEQKDGSWGVSRVRPDGGAAEAVVRGIPSRGDHWINYPAFDAAGNLWFGTGSATNSGVVSSHDPVDLKWIRERPDVHDVPCRDVVLAGDAFGEKSGIPPDEGARTTTGAFQAYRHAGERRIAGSDPCTSAVYRVRPGGKPEVVAWGFRNPVGLAVGGKGDIYVAMQGADVRGARPVLDDPDAVYRLREGAWYGWPDFSAALLPLTDPRYAPPAGYGAEGRPAPGFVLDHAKSGLSAPDRSLLVAATKAHAAVCGMTFVPAGGPFARWAGRLLVAEMGDFRPMTDPVHPTDHSGFQVEIVDPAAGTIASFVRNGDSGEPLPASAVPGEEGLERPVDVKFGPDGDLYVVDFGIFTPTEKSGKVLPKTGRVFRIEPPPAS